MRCVCVCVCRGGPLTSVENFVCGQQVSDASLSCVASGGIGVSSWECAAQVKALDKCSFIIHYIYIVEYLNLVKGIYSNCVC